MNEETKARQAEESWGMANCKGAVIAADVASDEVNIRQVIRSKGFGLCTATGIAEEYPTGIIGVFDSSVPRSKWLGFFRNRRLWIARIVTMSNRYDGSAVKIEVLGINNVELFKDVAKEIESKLHGRKVVVQLVRETADTETFISDYGY